MRTRKLSRTLGALLALCATVAAFGASGAGAAEPAPAWQLHVYGYATRFAPGSVGDFSDPPGYKVIAKNVGGGATTGKFTIVDELPTGVVPSFKLKPYGFAGPEAIQVSETLTCTSTTKKVTCTGNGPVAPGQKAEMVVPLEAKSTVPATITNSATIEGGGAAAASEQIQTTADGTSAPFGFLESGASAYGTATNADGTTATAAGSHPYQLSVGMNFNDVPPGEFADTIRVPGGGVKMIEAELPQGVVVNPNAVEKCTETQLESSPSAFASACPPGSQVGMVTLQLSLSGGPPGSPDRPLYNMVAPPGMPAEFGFEAIEGTYVHIKGGLRGADHFRLAANVSAIPAKVGVMGAETTLWGNPSDESHDAVRGECLAIGGLCTTERKSQAFLSMPSSCGGPLTTNLRIGNWIGETAADSYLSSDPNGVPVGVDGCVGLDFNPSIESKSTTNSGDSPTGLDFHLRVPQNESIGGRATANLKDARVTLPEGMTVNPAASAGLGSCTQEQIGLATEAPVACPDSSKVGAVAIDSPLIDHSLEGNIYLATPFENPFGTLIALYIGVEDPATGVTIKLSGSVEPDPTTGQLAATFKENPELPFRDFHLSFFNGPRATLTSPLTCGTHTTTSILTPWTTPEGLDTSPSDSFQTTTGCFSSEAAAPKTVDFTAGTATPLSGAYSPFVLRLARPDGSQHITGIDTTLPEGLLGKLSGVAYCPESGIAQAISREKVEQGKVEQASPSCPASSEVGTLQVTAGSGSSPIPVSGHAYLAGPYKNAPLSLVVIVPAVAGPFDLGTVVSRVALNVGEYDARVHAVSDPLPTIRDGIPLDVRSIELKLDRPSFTMNPTSCEAMQIEGSVSTQAGQSQPLSNRFQVGECGRLAFKPRLAISLKGQTKRAGHPSLKAVVTYPQKGAYANIARAQVNLPHSEFLDQGNIGKACTKVVLAQQACPAKSIYGKVKAWTPLLDRPLEGPVYLVGGYGYKLPALVAELNGQIRILLVGKVDTGKNKGIRNTFEAVPDAPVERFVLEMKGGKKYGLLENSENLCRKKQVAGTAFTAQNGKILRVSTKISNSCDRGKKNNRKKRHDAEPKRHSNR